MAKRAPAKANPTTLLHELEQGLASGDLPRGIVLRGEERYFRERALDALTRRALELGYEVCSHHAERGNADFQLSRAIGDLSGGGLFAGKRLVILRDGGEHLAKVDGKPSALTSAIEAFLAAEPAAGTIALSLTTLRLDHAVAKAIAKHGGPILDLRKLYDSPPPWKPDPRQVELVQWVAARARELGVRLSIDQAVYVCAATGNDLAALEDQLERLKGAPPERLRELVGWDTSTQPWTVAEPIVAGDLPRALAGLETLFRGGFQDKGGRRVLDTTALSTMLVASISRTVRRSLSIALALGAGVDEAEAAKAAGAAGRGAGPALAAAKRRTGAQWHAMLEEAADLERRAKSSGGLSVDHFVRFALRWALEAERATPRRRATARR